MLKFSLYMIAYTGNGHKLHSCVTFLHICFFFFKLYITVLVLPNIKMNLPQVHMFTFVFKKSEELYRPQGYLTFFLRCLLFKSKIE